MRKLLLLTALIVLFSPRSAFAALLLDGSSSAASSAITLTTSNSNDIIIAWSRASGTGVTISDTARLTWTQRGVANEGGNAYTIVFWALAPSPLSSDTITFGGTGAIRATAFGISGANTSTPFDGNGSLPSMNTNSASTSLSTVISTTNANDFVYTMLGCAGTIGTLTPPSGYTMIAAGGTQNAFYYDIVSATQSSVSVTYSYTSSTGCAMITDAIEAAGSGSVKENVLMGIQ